MERIYLDNNATTAPAQEVLEVMYEALTSGPSNPSSVHSYGREAKSRLILARDEIAQFFGVKSQELVFTSGGTEAINLLLKGSVSSLKKGKIISSNVEHASTETTLKLLENQGWVVQRLPVGSRGAVTSEQIEEAIDKETRLIVLSAANNETGVKIPLTSIAQLADANGIAFIVDGVALLGKEEFSLPKGLSGIAFSSHKIHGPKGVGLAIIRPSLRIQSQLTGGSQEFGKRAGTENLEGILGFARAIRLLKDQGSSLSAYTRVLRDTFEASLLKHCQAEVNGVGDRVCNVSNLAFPGIDGETLLIHLDLAGIAASHGSACSSGSLEPSRVLTNMGIPSQLVRSSIRFSFGRFNTQDDVQKAITIISDLVTSLRSLIISQ